LPVLKIFGAAKDILKPEAAYTSAQMLQICSG